VLKVDAGGPAAEAGLQTGDIVVGAGGEALEGLDSLHRLLSRWPRDLPLALEALRGRNRITAHVLPGQASPER
jgi:S1-C subfamily serine protease